METINQYPKPKPIRGVCFPDIFLPGHKIPHLKDPTPFAILKYFPKHIDRLPYDLSHPNLKTRIKHLKIIRRIPNHDFENPFRTLFANKRKCVKFADGVENQEESGYDKHSLDLLKMFPNIQKVEFCVIKYVDDEGGSQWQAEQYYHIDKMSRYLRKMPNLKYLDLSYCAGSFAGLLSKINSFETMLSRLEYFKLSFYRPSSEIQALINSPNIVKHLTHFIQLGPTYDAEILKYLQDFQNLRILSLDLILSSYRLDTFRHCKFPISLRTLDLYFRRTDWQGLVAKVAFLSEIGGLENLEKLQIACLPEEKEEKAFQDFLEQFLSKILLLKEFQLTTSSEYLSRAPPRPLDMSRFLSCFKHLSQSLQRLTFCDPNPLYNFTNLENTHAFHFPELSYLRLQGQGFSSLHVLENTLALVQTKPDAPAPEIKFGIKMDSSRSLLELLNSVKRISGKKIRLAINYEYTGGEDDGYFKENYEQVKQSSENLKNVSFVVHFRQKIPKWEGELMSLKELFEYF